jgi:hypothetical protein
LVNLLVFGVLAALVYSPSFWLFLVICDKPSCRLASRFSYRRLYANVFITHEVAETDTVVGDITGGWPCSGHLGGEEERKPLFSLPSLIYFQLQLIPSETDDYSPKNASITVRSV